MLEFTTFDYEDPTSHMMAFLQRFHTNGNSEQNETGRLFVRFGKSFKSIIENGNVDFLARMFFERFENNKEINHKDVFCSLNIFTKNGSGKKGTGKNEMRRNNLYLYDLIAYKFVPVDIDSDYNEKRLMQNFLAYCNDKTYCVPNGFMYEGDGSVTLLYSLEPCKDTLGNAITALKYTMAKEFEKFLARYARHTGCVYKLDKKLFKSSSMIRMPGTQNTSTGRMCELILTNVETYSFQKLLDYQDVDMTKWDRITNAALNNRNTEPMKESELIDSMESGKLGIKGKDIHYGSKVKRLMQYRIDGLFEWFSDPSRLKFYDVRRNIKICFMLRQFCKTIGMPVEEEIETVCNFNTRFCRIRKEQMLMQTTGSRIYKFTNEYIAKLLDVSVSDPEFIKTFHIKTEKLKKYGMKGNRLKRAGNYKAVARAMEYQPDITNAELVEKTGLSLDQVKKIAADLRKNSSAIKFWSWMELSIKSEAEKAEAYLNTHGYNKKASAEKYKKTKEAMKESEEVEIENEIPANVEGLINYARTELKNIESRDPRNKQFFDFLVKCKKFLILKPVKYEKDIDRIESFLLLCGVPKYTAKHLIHGYEHYTKADLDDYNDFLFNGTIVVPEPHYDLMYAIESYLIKSFPTYDKNGFTYRTSTLEKYYYGYSYKKGIKKLSPVPKMYYGYQEKISSIKKVLSKLHQKYNKAILRYDFPKVNSIVGIAETYVGVLQYMTSEYNLKLKELCKKESRYIGFDQRQANMMTRMIIIEESIKSKVAAYSSVPA